MSRSAFFRQFRFVNACLIVMAIGGCIKVGGSDEGGDESGDCESDSECDDDEICNDGDCEPIGSGGTNAGGASSGGRSGSSTGGTSRGGTSSGGASAGGASNGGASSGGSGGGTTDACGTFCDFSLRCGDGTDIGECLSSCDSLYVVGGACATALDAMSGCIRTNGPDCNAISSSCSSPAQGVISSCGDGSCPFTNDDECDEPEGTNLCPEGTDAADCTGCGFTLDGDCDEPEGLNLCPEGSDVIDCGCPEGEPGNTCTWNCDAVCDQPDLCETGTDAYDCANYPP